MEGYVNRIVFGTDLDDCIVETASEIIKELGYGSKEILSRIGSFSISESLNIPRELVNHAIDKTLERTDLKFNSSFYLIYPVLMKLVGHLYVITSRRSHLENGRTILRKLFREDEFTLINSDRYGNGIPRKAEVIRQYGINLFVEDRFATAVDIIEKTNCFVILLAKPWNKRLTQPDRLIRVSNWYEILDFLRKVVKL